MWVSQAAGSARRSVGVEMLGCQRSKHTEFVALRVGHHDPGHVGALPYVSAARTKSFEPSHLRSLILRSQVKVQAILARLALWDAVEYEVGHDSVFGGTGRRLEDHLLVALVRAAPPQSGLPEAR